MAAFVKSVEERTASFGTTAGPTSVDISLTKGQNDLQCVPFYTARTPGAGSVFTQNHALGLQMLDVSGTPTVRLHRRATATVQTMEVVVYVVEFTSAVTVQRGTIALTGTINSATINQVVSANAFITHSQVMSSTAGTDDLNDTFIRTAFGTLTQVDALRAAAGDPDWTVYFYVVESNGTDFKTEAITYAHASAETGPTNQTLIQTINLANAFMVCGYQNGEVAAAMRDGMVNHALTGTTQWTWYRNNNAVPADVGQTNGWVVRATAAEFNVQRFAYDLAASATNDQTITSVDRARSICLSSSNVGIGAWSVDGSIAGADLEDRQNSIIFLNDTTVRLQQQQPEASTGADSRLRFEVIEFELAPVIASGAFSSAGTGQVDKVGAATADGAASAAGTAVVAKVGAAIADGVVSVDGITQVEMVGAAAGVGGKHPQMTLLGVGV